MGADRRPPRGRGPRAGHLREGPRPSAVRARRPATSPTCCAPWPTSTQPLPPAPAAPRRGPALEDAGGRLTAAPEDAYAVRELFATIAGLEHDRRAALVAVDVVGLSYAEAAALLDVKEATLTTRLHRARRAVADALSAEEAVRPMTHETDEIGARIRAAAESVSAPARAARAPRPRARAPRQGPDARQLAAVGATLAVIATIGRLLGAGRRRPSSSVAAAALHAPERAAPARPGLPARLPRRRRPHRHRRRPRRRDRHLPARRRRRPLHDRRRRPARPARRPRRARPAARPRARPRRRRQPRRLARVRQDVRARLARREPRRARRRAAQPPCLSRRAGRPRRRPSSRRRPRRATRCP